MNSALQWFRRRAILETISLWIVAAVSLQALIPTGFMLSGGEGVSLQLCRGIPLPGSLGDPAPADPRADHPVCAFAAGHVWFDAPATRAVAAGAAARGFPFLRPDFASVSNLQGPQRTQSPRAPPRTA